MNQRHRHNTAVLVFSCLVIFLAGRCDTVEPVQDAMLVVEGYVDAGHELPALSLSQTVPMSRTNMTDSGFEVTDAEVLVYIDDVSVEYRHNDLIPGQYDPDPTIGSVLATPRSFLGLDVRWLDQHATMGGKVPPIIKIDSLRIDIPDEPVQAVLLDSLQIADSLNTGAKEGYIYPVDVTIWWTVDYLETEVDSIYWIETQLTPFTMFSSTLIDFFLLPEQVFREKDIPRDFQNRRSWTGVYAVSVGAQADPIPPHGLKVSLLRSGSDYARFASSKDAPERREPVSNIYGALGVFVGISVDSVRVQVE